jgi:hypothetical protein
MRAGWLPGYIWALPLSLVGGVKAWRRGIVSWRWWHGCLELVVRELDEGTEECVRGWVVLHAQDEVIYDQTRYHALRHVHQSLVLGPLAPLAFAVCGAVAEVLGGEFYWDNWLEADAREYARRRMGR